MENSNDTGKLIGALVIGALAGAALGVLFAPDKGSNTRNKLINGAKDIADDLTKKVKDEAIYLRNRAMELEEIAEGKLNNLVSSAKDKMDTTKNHN